MTYFRTASVTLVFFLFSFVSAAQTLTQTVRGTVVDRHIQTPMIGATVVIAGSNPLIGATTDINGHFKMEQVPVGVYTLHITYLGYKEIFLPNVTVNSGKETVLNIEMEENIISSKEVIVTADAHKEKPLNEMSMVSARTFSVEETQKFAAAINDPGRMVSSFAGVVSTDDGSNNISIRGNSPNGLLWRMEGVDIPNPNHFSNVGSSGGGVAILSAQVLSNSDFLTGAFAAEYGNALSGVFDLKLRKGNNEKKEFTVKAGVLGLDFAAEGPFAKDYSGSYLVNYRYSTLGILSKMGVLGDESLTTFQDLSFNIFLPTKKYGYFSVFGFGGLSKDVQHAKKDSVLWIENINTKYDDVFFANSGAAGITHSFIINPKTYIRSSLSLSKTSNGDKLSFCNEEYNLIPSIDEKYEEQKLTLMSTLNYKFNAKNLLRSGITVSNIRYNLKQSYYNSSTESLEQFINSQGSTNLLQTFSEWQYRPVEKLTFTGGVHYMELLLNHTFSVEPRAALRWEFSRKQSVSFGYGLVSQIQPLGIYFSEATDGTGNISMPNKKLEFTKANHFVVSYDYLLTPQLRLKTEFYYQMLFHVPIDTAKGSTYSILNQSQDYYMGALQNNGTGRNYGVEFTLEKFLSNHYYFLLSSSLYQAKYTAQDGVERNTRFNTNYVNALTAGKDFEWNKRGKNRTFGINTKILYMGGMRSTPINLNKSIEENTVVYDEGKAFSIQSPAYFRFDAGVSLKNNHRKFTSTWQFDVQNVTNRKNIGGQYFSTEKNKIITYYQTPLIPVLSYKVEF